MNSFKKERYIITTALIATTLMLFCGCAAVSDPSPAGNATTTQSNTQGNTQKDLQQVIKITPKPETEEAPALTSQLPQIDSSTARIPITNAIYELFTNEYGYEGPEPISSKTHGAWLNLADSKADIIFLVAPTEDELSYFAEKNVDIEMKVYGYDGLVFIGNKSNPVQNITTQQIRDIYSGKINNWSEIGGEEADIIVYIRNQESGSQRLFESLVWDGYDMPDFSAMNFSEGEINPDVTQRSIQEHDDMGGITYDVLLNQYSIGFNIMSYIDNEFHDSELKLFAINNYAPATENFTSGKYPFLTTSYVAIRASEPEDSPARKLYDWVGTEESYNLISQNSTLTVAFSESIIIQAGMGFSGNKINNPSTSQDSLADIISKLNQQYINREDLLTYTLDEIGYLRNGVYALSGKIFTTDKYINYFSAQSWYKKVTTSDTDAAQTFNDYQKKNLEVIIAYENEIK